MHMGCSYTMRHMPDKLVVGGLSTLRQHMKSWLVERDGTSHG